MSPTFSARMGTLRFLITLIVVVQKLCHGQNAQFELFSMEKCAVAGDAEEYDSDMELREVGENEYAAYAYVTPTEPITDDFTFSLLLEKWEDGQWVEKSSVEGNMWEYIDKYIPRVYEKLTTLCEPNLPAKFPIEPGTYKADGLTILSDDMDIPAGMEGRFHLTMRANSPDGNVLCQIADVEMSK